MPDINALSNLATRLGVNFTGFLSHEKVVQLADAWLPDINFHEDERFHIIDLEDLYTIPSTEFAAFNAAEMQEFAINVNGQPVSPPIVRRGGETPGFGDNAQTVLEQPEFHFDAVYTHGGSLKASEKFFISPTVSAGPENPRVPRWPLRPRAEFRMLLETLKSDLALAEAREQDPDEVNRKPIDAIWGDFDVTDLLLRRVDEEGFDNGAASPSVRQQFARDLIAEFEAGNLFAVQDLLEAPPRDGTFDTQANRTVWLALSTCGFLEYYFVYAFNDFSRYGGFFTNEHEGDVEGCCLVFERERLAPFQVDDNADPAAIGPLGLITSVHEEFNNADELRPLDEDPGDARDGLDVYVARGSHATYLTAGEHDFFDLSDLLGHSAGAAAALILATALFPELIVFLAIYEHFNGDPDQTSENGAVGQTEVNPASDPDTHFAVEMRYTPLSNFTPDAGAPEPNIYDLSLDGNPRRLARRAFGGRLGSHDGLIDHSSSWGNKTRRYFRHLVRAIETGRFRPPREPIIIG